MLTFQKEYSNLEKNNISKRMSNEGSSDVDRYNGEKKLELEIKNLDNSLYIVNYDSGEVYITNPYKGKYRLSEIDSLRIRIKYIRRCSSVRKNITIHKEII